MSNQEITLCASNAYNKKFYLNDNFKGLPEAIKEELQIMCVLYTEDVGDNGRTAASSKMQSWEQNPPAVRDRFWQDNPSHSCADPLQNFHHRQQLLSTHQGTVLAFPDTIRKVD